MDNSKDITQGMDSGLFDGLFDSATGIILVVLIVLISRHQHEVDVSNLTR